MFDENLSILEGADYAADTFWFEEERDLKDGLLFEINDEIDIVTVECTSTLIQEMSQRFDDFFSWNADGSIKQLRDSAQKIEVEIKNFLAAYERLRSLKDME